MAVGGHDVEPRFNTLPQGGDFTDSNRAGIFPQHGNGREIVQSGGAAINDVQI